MANKIPDDCGLKPPAYYLAPPMTYNAILPNNESRENISAGYLY